MFGCIQFLRLKTENPHAEIYIIIDKYFRSKNIIQIREITLSFSQTRQKKEEKKINQIPKFLHFIN